MPRRRPFVCCVPKCDSREAKFREDQDFHLYKFPSDKPLMRKWVAVIGRGDNFIPTERTRICSKHFQSGKRNYKPSSVDYIPSIFWYNVPKVSEYCTGCRRKVCKCEPSAEDPETIDIEARIQELQNEEGEEDEDMDDIPEEYTAPEAEEYVLEGEGDSGSQNMQQSSSSYMEAQSFLPMGDTDVTVAIASFLQEEYDPGEVEPDPQHSLLDEKMKIIVKTDDVVMAEEDEIASSSIVIPFIDEEPEPPQIPTSFDETIERVIRWEDCADISARPTVPKGVKAKTDSEQEEVATGSNQEEIQDHNDEPQQLQPEPMEEEVVSTDAAKPVVQEPFVEPYDPNSELEREWRRRERKLIKHHKAEEKKILMQMVQSNQNKNQTIDELKKEVKELKKSNKALQQSMDLLEIRLREEFEAKYKLDVKKLLDEANMNLAILQTGWTQEKKILLQANSALAKVVESVPASLETASGIIELASVTQFASTPTATVQVQEPISVGEPKEKSLSQNTGNQNLRFESCEDSSETVKYFTGIPSKYDFDAFFDLLKEKAKTMRYWNGKAWNSSSSEAKRQKSHRIDLKNQLFLTLCRLKRGFTTKELGFFFGVDPVFVSCIFITFCKLIESELCDLYLRDYQPTVEFAGLPEIVQTHYPKLYATLRITEIRLETRPCLNLNSKFIPKKQAPTFKVLFLFTPNGHIFFISPIYPGKTSDRVVILESKVFDMIPAESEVFVDKEFDVSEECISRQLQLHVFPHTSSHTLTEDDPWEIKLMTKCKSRMEKLIGLMRYFRIFDNDLHVAGANHTPMTVRLALLMQYYYDTKCFTYLLRSDETELGQ